MLEKESGGRGQIFAGFARFHLIYWKYSRPMQAVIIWRGSIMKRVLACLATIILALCLVPAGSAVWELPFSVDSQAVYLVHVNTGTVVLDMNGSQRRSPASLTKMVTALLLMESGEDLDTVVAIPEHLQAEFDFIQSENGSDADLKIGEQITLRNLLYGMMLPSGNDAASVIGDYLSGGDLDAFAVQMTEYAAALGCEDTRFSCAHGLADMEDGNWSTARDMALILQAVSRNQALLDVMGTVEWWMPLSNMHTEPKTYTDAETPAGMAYRVRNTNSMLAEDSAVYRSYVVAGKSGFTNQAGRCFASFSRQGEDSWILVVMGARRELDDGVTYASRDTVAILDWALERFAIGQAPEETGPLAEVPVLWNDKTDTVSVWPAQTITALLDKEQPTEWQLALPEQLETPLKAGQTVGEADLYINGDLIGTVPLEVRDDLSRSWWLHFTGTHTTGQIVLLIAAVLLAILLVAAVAVLRLRCMIRKRRRRKAAAAGRYLYRG